MITKDIHILIERVKREWPDAGIVADKALLAVDAIERAAQEIVLGDDEARVKAAMAFMESIAKEAE